MTMVHFLSAKPLSQKTTRARHADVVLLNVMKHNFREIPSEMGEGADNKIDPSRTDRNVVLTGLGSAFAVSKMAKDLMTKIGPSKVRKNATLGIEIIFSLRNGMNIDYDAYFRDAWNWSQRYFDVPIVSAVIHNDEACPHLHVVLLPVRGGQLIGSKLLGDRTKTKAMQKNFYESVGKRYGLSQPAPEKRFSASIKRSAIEMASQALAKIEGINSDLIRVLLEAFKNNPVPLMNALKLDMPKPKQKHSFVEMMTKPCRPDTPERIFKST